MGIVRICNLQLTPGFLMLHQCDCWLSVYEWMRGKWGWEQVLVDVCFSTADEMSLLVFWAQSTTRDYIRAENEFLLITLCTGHSMWTQFSTSLMKWCEALRLLCGSVETWYGTGHFMWTQFSTSLMKWCEVLRLLRGSVETWYGTGHFMWTQFSTSLMKWCEVWRLLRGSVETGYGTGHFM